MVKIINSVIGFYKGADYLYISLLNGKSYYLVKRSKQYNVKNMFIGNGWGSICSWKPLGFERSIIYA